MEEIAAVDLTNEIQEEDEISHEPIISAFTQNVSHEREVFESNDIEGIEHGEIVDDVHIQGADTLENADYQLPSYNLLQLPPQHDQSGEYSVIQANAKKTRANAAKLWCQGKSYASSFRTSSN